MASADSPAAAPARRHEFVRVYVWEAPVRWFHWINAVSIAVLMVTGWLIAHPIAFLTTHSASAAYWFGTARFLHFAAGYIFVAALMMRVYWAFKGNKFSRWRNFVPLTAAQWREMAQVARADVLQVSNVEAETPGHNAAAYFTYAGAFLLAIFQIVTGFALYAQTSPAWFPRLFAWIAPRFGSEYRLREYHYAAMWLFVLFVMIHVYLVIYHDYIEGHGTVSSIFGGWKYMEKHAAEDPNAPGMSRFPPRPPAGPPA